MLTFWKKPAVVDFVERVGSTAFEAGAAVYMTSPNSPIVLRTSGAAAGIAALKYVVAAVKTWQSKLPPT